MFLMMGRRDDPLTQWPMHNRFGKHLPTHMVANPHEGHDGEDHSQTRNMNGNDEHKRGNNNRPRHGLPRMKAHRRPGGWGAAVMMHSMGNAEQPGLMHPAMRPIKPCVMGQQKEQNRNGQIPERIVRRVSIYLRPTLGLPAPSHNASWRAINASRGKAPANFAPYLPIKPRVKPAMPQTRCPGKGPAGQEITAAHNQRHRKGGTNQGWERIHNAGLAHQGRTAYRPLWEGATSCKNSNALPPHQDRPTLTIPKRHGLARIALPNGFIARVHQNPLPSLKPGRLHQIKLPCH